MRVTFTVPNKSNPENFNLIYNGCVEETTNNVPKITEILKGAVSMYKSKEIHELTGMEFIDFVNHNERLFNLHITELKCKYIAL